MSKISPLMGVNARFGKEVRQTANAFKKAAASATENQTTKRVIIKNKFNPSDIKPAEEFRAVFPQLHAPQNAATGCHMDIKGQKINLYA